MENLNDLLLHNVWIKQIIWCVIIMVTVRILFGILNFFLNRAIKRGLDKAAVPLLSSLIKYATYILTLLLCLDILGVNTAGIIAMIGAASLAIGLALKDTLSNIASGLLLLFLRPFGAGDYIECGSVKGKIGGIGLFTTTMDTRDGLFVSVPNSVLLGAPIVNFSRNPIRRLEMTVAVAYDTPIEKVLNVLRQVVSADDRFLKSPTPQFFVSDMEESAINVTFRAWVKSENFGPLMCEYKGVLKQRLDENGIEIPFPQRVLHIKKDSV